MEAQRSGSGAAAKHNLPAGIAAICGAFFASALTGVLSKLAHGVSPLTTVFFQYTVSLVIFLPLALRGGWRGLKTQRPVLQAVRSGAGAGAQVLYFVALKTLPLLSASLLANASPLFIPLVVWAWLRKPVQGVVWGSLAIGLAGVVLVIRPSAAMLHDPASLIALASAVLSAVGLVTTNKLAETDPPFRILAYYFGLPTLLLLPVTVWRWQPLPWRTVGLLVGVGLCFAATQWLIIVAYRYASATELSPFNYSVVVFSGLLGWAVFGTVPGWNSVAGTVLIIAGGVMSIEGGHLEGLGHWIGTGHWTKEWAAHWRRRPWKRVAEG